MTDPRRTPCTVLWCDSTTHPYETIVRHRAPVAVFAGGMVPVMLVWAERFDGRRSLPAHLQVARGDTSTYQNLVDLSPGAARLWAEIFAALDPAEVLRFARALVDGATTLGGGGDQ